MISKSVEPVFPFTYVDALRRETIRPLSHRNRRLGSGQCHGAFHDWVADPYGVDIGPFGCKAGNLPKDIPQEELTCLYQGEPIGENS